MGCVMGVAAAARPGRAIDVDVKAVLADASAPSSRRTAALLAPALSAESKRRKLLVTSFDAGLLTALRPDLPDAAFGLLTWLYFPPQHGIPAAAGLGLDVIALHTGSLAPVEEDTDAAGAPRAEAHPFPAAGE